MPEPGKTLTIDFEEQVAELEAEKGGNFLPPTENLQLKYNKRPQISR